MKERILHALSIRSTWVTLASTIGLTLTSCGINIPHYEAVTSGLLAIVTVIGVFKVAEAEGLTLTDKDE